MEGMPRKRPAFVIREKNRHGNWRWYFRKKGTPRVRLPDEYGTEEFWAAYNAALTGQAVEKPRPASSGTLEWLVKRYMASAHYVCLAETTQRSRGSFYRGVCKKSGHIDFRRITKKKIQEAMDARAKTPYAANNFLVAMSVLFDWAVKNEFVTDNPCQKVTPIKVKSAGYHTWTMEEVEQYRARHPLGTRQRLAVDLLLFTGLRISDAILAGRQHVRDGVLTITTGKTGTVVSVPIFPELRRSIDATKTGTLTFLVGARGRPFTSSFTFGAWFRKACDDAGLTHCTAHGLRKAGATIAANSGATVHELMAMFGWSRSSMAEIYTKKADRARLARAAAERIANAQVSNPAPGCGPTEENSGGNNGLKSAT
jgi:integrase